MNKLIKAVALMTVLLVTQNANAEVYSVSITRQGDNLYEIDFQEVFIRTRFCFEFAMSEKAVLSYSPRSSSNKLIFKNGRVCDVANVFSAL